MPKHVVSRALESNPLRKRITFLQSQNDQYAKDNRALLQILRELGIDIPGNFPNTYQRRPRVLASPEQLLAHFAQPTLTSSRRKVASIPESTPIAARRATPKTPPECVAIQDKIYEYRDGQPFCSPPRYLNSTKSSAQKARDYIAPPPDDDWGPIPLKPIRRRRCTRIPRSPHYLNETAASILKKKVYTPTSSDSDQSTEQSEIFSEAEEQEEICTHKYWDCEDTCSDCGTNRWGCRSEQTDGGSAPAGSPEPLLIQSKPALPKPEEHPLRRLDHTEVSSLFEDRLKRVIIPSTIGYELLEKALKLSREVIYYACKQYWPEVCESHFVSGPHEVKLGYAEIEYWYQYGKIQREAGHTEYPLYGIIDLRNMYCHFGGYHARHTDAWDYDCHLTKAQQLAEGWGDVDRTQQIVALRNTVRTEALRVIEQIATLEVWANALPFGTESFQAHHEIMFRRFLNSGISYPEVVVRTACGWAEYHQNSYLNKYSYRNCLGEGTNPKY
ncbi:hypothetical protein F4780DRAFT_793284 [Xylariomycetidae sp. FL0641]|nr:hypothetical protein F4780DRAFT_793284 [Xylariomycetidae sp. FL0641]